MQDSYVQEKTMINKKIETFLVKNNMNYLFCMLSNLEVQRINQLPSYVKQKFTEKITEISMEHVAENDIPDYIIELAEAELLMAQQENPFDDEDNDLIIDETIDDRAKFVDDIQTENFEPFADDDEVDFIDVADDDDEDED